MSLDSLSAIDLAALKEVADANKKVLADLARVVADRYGVTLDNSQPAKGPRRYLLLNVHRHENGERDGDLIEEPLKGAAGQVRGHVRLASTTMMPDEHNARERQEQIGARSSGRPVAEHWLPGLTPAGLTPDDIINLVERHLAEHRRGYHTGAGDQLFHVLQSQIRKALEAKHPALDRADEVAERPRRTRCRRACWPVIVA
jgi:hypothetical protein